MSIDRSCIGLWLWQGVQARFFRHLIGLARDQLIDRHHLDGRCWDRQLSSVQDDLLRPFVLGSDPDGRPFDDLRSIRKTLWQLWRRPAGYQQKNSKRASDNDKVSGYGHSR